MLRHRVQEQGVQTMLDAVVDYLLAADAMIEVGTSTSGNRMIRNTPDNEPFSALVQIMTIHMSAARVLQVYSGTVVATWVQRR